jgi:hypothetical protein
MTKPNQVMCTQQNPSPNIFNDDTTNYDNVVYEDQLGEDAARWSTLQWPLLGCHIVLLSKDVMFECIPFQIFERCSQYFCILC